jgi:hypothetical protein
MCAENKYQVTEDGRCFCFCEDGAIEVWLNTEINEG